MISKNLYINILLRVFLIVLLSILLGFILFKGYPMRYSIVILTVIIAVTAGLISYLNRINRNISYFFNAVKNDENNLTFPVKGLPRHLTGIYNGMNNVNKQIQQLKFRNSRQEEYFKKILEHLATGIITYDRKGFIVLANSAAKRLFSADVLTHLNQLEKFDENLSSVIMNIKPNERRLIRLNTLEGEIQLSLKTTSFGSGENELSILSVQDIRYELDEKEVETWMKLIRVLMHEIMNSISPITSLSESLSKIYRPDNKPISPDEISEKTIETTLKGLDAVRKQGQSLMSFVDSYRTLTRIPKPEKKLFLVSGLFSRIEPLSDIITEGKKTIIRFSYEADIELFADENLVSQVLINLIKNAVEANENNKSADIRVTARFNNHVPEICVFDNGPGINPDHLNEVFVPFFTTRENGSGIGLSISRQIMRAHGGHLTVRSKPGVETVFCMRFSD